MRLVEILYFTITCEAHYSQLYVKEKIMSNGIDNGNATRAEIKTLVHAMEKAIRQLQPYVQGSANVDKDVLGYDSATDVDGIVGAVASAITAYQSS